MKRPVENSYFKHESTNTLVQNKERHFNFRMAQRIKPDVSVELVRDDLLRVRSTISKSQNFNFSLAYISTGYPNIDRDGMRQWPLKRMKPMQDDASSSCIVPCVPMLT